MIAAAAGTLAHGHYWWLGALGFIALVVALVAIPALALGAHRR